MQQHNTTYYLFKKKCNFCLLLDLDLLLNMLLCSSPPVCNSLLPHVLVYTSGAFKVSLKKIRYPILTDLKLKIVPETEDTDRKSVWDMSHQYSVFFMPMFSEADTLMSRPVWQQSHWEMSDCSQRSISHWSGTQAINGSWRYVKAGKKALRDCKRLDIGGR